MRWNGVGWGGRADRVDVFVEWILDGLGSSSWAMEMDGGGALGREGLL